MKNGNKAFILLMGLFVLGCIFSACGWYLNRPRIQIIPFTMRTGNISDFERGCLASSQRIEQASEARLKWAEDNGIKPRPVVVKYSRQMKAGLPEKQYRDSCQAALLKGGTINFENRLRLSSLQ